MMSLTKLITSSLVLIYYLVALNIGNASLDKTLCEKEDISLNFLNSDVDAIERIKQNLLSGTRECHIQCRMKPMDCVDLLYYGHTKSGVYTIWPKNRIINGKVDVYCDMETNGGGWTVIQRRGDFGRPEDYFFKHWESYKRGFGNIKEDFWLGNDLISAISNQASYSIRFDLSDVEGNTSHALYEDFWIEDEEAQYRLHISNYSGDAGDSMKLNDNQKFSTKDKKNDQSSCSVERKGAWWYANCGYSNLNGLFLMGKNNHSGLRWYQWKDSDESLYTTEMKIRPKYFHKF